MDILHCISALSARIVLNAFYHAFPTNAAIEIPNSICKRVPSIIYGHLKCIMHSELLSQFIKSVIFVDKEKSLVDILCLTVNRHHAYTERHCMNG